MDDLLVPWVAIASMRCDDRSRRAIAGRVPIICSPITSKLEERNQRVPHLQGVQRDERGVFSWRVVGSPASEECSPIQGGARDGRAAGSTG